MTKPTVQNRIWSPEQIDELWSDALLLSDPTKTAAALAVMGFNTYCQQAGITGVNDGSRDDGALMMTAKALAVAAGAKLLVIGPGNVHVNARTADAVYPNDYVCRVTEDDFWIVIAPGTRFVDHNTSNPGSRGFNDIFQFTGLRSGLINLGQVSHASPSVTAGVANNFSTLCHLTSPSDQCFYANGGVGVVSGFCCTTQGVIDNSSANRAYIYGAIVRNCVKGVVQSSTDSAVKALIANIDVDGYQAVTGQGGVGLGINGADVTLAGFIKINNSTYSGTLGSAAISCDSSSVLDELTAGGATIRLSGPGSGTANQSGIVLNGSSWSATKVLDIGELHISGFAAGSIFTGMRKNIHIGRYTSRDTTFALERTSDGTHNCTGDISIDSIDISDTFTALYSGDASQTGKLFISGGTIALRSGSGGALFSNTTTAYPLGTVRTINAAGTVTYSPALPTVLS